MPSVNSSPPEAGGPQAGGPQAGGSEPSPGAAPGGGPAFGVYVHVPYCARACPYCDFDFRVDARPDGRALLEQLQAELEARIDARRGDPAHTVYVGGGTPSVLSPQDLQGLLRWIGSTWQTGACVEWTVEFNPEHADEAHLRACSDGGVDRISLGVQSFDAQGLRQLGRAHTPAQAQAAVSRARDQGLKVSVDLIVGWPGQQLEGLQREVETAVSLGVDHVSVYALTIEPGTPWERLVERGVRRLPRADTSADALLACEALLEAAGLQHYEVASYARPGADAQHNTGYWCGRDYVGVGPSAASARYEGAAVVRTTNPRGQAWWDGHPPQRETLSGEACAREALWLALRRLQGVKIEGLLTRIGRDRAWLEARVAKSLSRGNIRLTEGTIAVAPGRWLHHDDIAADVL